MYSKIEIADVPGVGVVAAQIFYDVHHDGTEHNRLLRAAKYSGTPRDVEAELRAAVAEAFDAHLE